MWSGHGRRPNSRVHEITGKPEQNSQILFVVHILGCFGNVMSMGWPPLHTLFSLRGGLFGDPMPTYIWTPAEENRRMECRLNHTHLVPKATKNINYEQKFRISFRFSNYFLNSGIWATPMARPLRFPLKGKCIRVRSDLAATKSNNSQSAPSIKKSLLI